MSPSPCSPRHRDPVPRAGVRAPPLYPPSSSCPAPPGARHLCVSRTSSADAPATEAYSAGQIKVLEGLEAVRKRPGMYIGSTGVEGLHHLIFEVVDNSMDEVQGGFASEVRVEMDLAARRVTVRDDGRGIPTDTHSKTGKTALETVLTVLHAGGKFGTGGYAVSGGLHGVGISVVNALSEVLDVRVWRGGTEYTQQYKLGHPQDELAARPAPPDAPSSGTEVAFTYDESIFIPSAKLDPERVVSRLRELAFLNHGARVHFRAVGGANGSAAYAEWTEFCYTGGLGAYVSDLTSGKGALHETLHVRRDVEGVGVELALQWCDEAGSAAPTIVGFANNIKNKDGGTHVEGLQRGVTKVVNDLAERRGLLPGGASAARLKGDHIRAGLTAAVSVRVAEPEFQGQTKDRLCNAEARNAVQQAVTEGVGEAFELNPGVFEAVVRQALQAQRQDEAARRARDVVRRKSVLSHTRLPGKLADCQSTDPAETEIFIVEGDSAGGSAKQGRDRKFQAILPLRGKIINCMKATPEQLLKNEEIASLIVALGIGAPGAPLDESQLRYQRVIVLTDADVDGAHIRTLLLAFLFQYKPDLFEKGYVYVGMPPLYRVDAGRGHGPARFCYDDAELRAVQDHFAQQGVDVAKLSVQRFKGLGEMNPQQLWETTLDPATRVLKRMSAPDQAEAAACLERLMGSEVGPRKELIEANASRFGMGDLDV
ncbi:unnamed protein product [Pedinophyceae sp. YPF-701]|nr:unnamed protein product [Pedinophyceae sp. YPF-701]